MAIGNGEELTIMQVSLGAGLSEPALRYYEKVGLVRGCPAMEAFTGVTAETVTVLGAVACLRSAGMSVGDMRHYLSLLERGSGVHAAA
jgi:DNA-binding transcriptional MerR regulator